jgi:hypothetical protein
LTNDLQAKAEEDAVTQRLLFRERELQENDRIANETFMIRQAVAKREEEVERNKNAAITSMQMNTWALAAELIQQFAGKSKAAAIAVIAIQKALAIAQVVMNTQVAVMRGYAELGPVAGTANALRMETLQAIQIGLIAATGLAQASQVGSGGASVGSPANPLNTTSTAGRQFNTPTPPSVMLNLTVNGHILDTQEFTDTILVPALKDAIDNRDVTIIGANSRQAANLVAA